MNNQRTRAKRYSYGGVGACSPRKILEFRGYEIASGTHIYIFLAQYDASRRPDDSFIDSKEFFALFAAISQASTRHLRAWGPCVGVRRATALIGDTKQATSEGKSGPVETGLTGPAATALHCSAAHDPPYKVLAPLLHKCSVTLSTHSL